MRIALINPNQYLDYPQPHLGLLSVAAVCIKEGHDVTLIDANAHNLTDQEIIKRIECTDMVGLTASSFSYPEAERLARVIRKHYPHRFLVLGGIHASLMADEIIKERLFDAVVAGEGERLMPLVLNLMDRGAYHSNNGVVADVNELPILPYYLLNGFRPRIAYGKHQKFMPILTARGCPFACSFCSNPVFGRVYRAMSVDRVMEEIIILRQDCGVKEIKIYDDVFTLDKQRAIEISKAIGSMNIAWSCMTRVNLVDIEVLKAMKAGGCYSVAYGLESGDSTILKSISKNTTLEQAREAVALTREAGIRTIGYFMLGAPGETLETINRTTDFACSLGLDHAQFSIATALPGSELYNHVPEGMRANCYAIDGMENPSICELSPAQLKMAQREAYRRVRKGK